MPDVLVEIRASLQEFQQKMATAKSEMDDVAKHGATVGSKLSILGACQMSSARDAPIEHDRTVTMASGVVAGTVP
jgi:hypothetical protein